MKMPKFDRSNIYRFVDKYFGYLALVIVILVVGLGMYYIVYPEWQEVQGVELLRVKETEQKLEDAQQYIDDLKKMRDKYANVDYRDIQRLKFVLPREFDQEHIFLTLKEFGATSGLSVTSLTVAASTSTSSGSDATSSDRRRTTEATTSPTDSEIGTIREVNIEMRVEGVDSYTSFKKFLALIENNAPLLDLAEVAWPNDGNTASVELVSYYLADL